MKKKILIGAALAIVLAVSGGVISAQKKPKNQAQAVVTLENLDGTTFATGSFKGKVTVLAIGATWLPLAREQAKIINQLSQNYANKDVVMYFISTDASDVKSKNYADNAKLKDFGTKNKLSSAILRDTNGTTLRFYNLDQIPAFIILNKDGEISEVVTGLDADDEGVKSTSAAIAAAIDKTL